jgi:hypothetical protein
MMNGAVRDSAVPERNQISQWRDLRGGVRLALVAVLVLLAASLLTYWVEPDIFRLLTEPHRGHGITAENAAQLRPGMTRGDVIRILGCDDGEYTGPHHLLWRRWGRVDATPGAPAEYFMPQARWLNRPNGTVVVIYFDRWDEATQRVTKVRSFKVQASSDRKPKELPCTPF